MIERMAKPNELQAAAMLGKPVEELPVALANMRGRRMTLEQISNATGLSTNQVFRMLRDLIEIQPPKARAVKLLREE